MGERVKATPSLGPAINYAYDQAGNLTSVKRAAEGETPAIDTGYTFDGSGLLASRTSGLTTQHMAWDQGAPLPLLLNDDVNSYIYGPNGLPIIQIDVEEAPTYLHHDQLGSTRLLTDEAGETAASFTYSAYGQPAAETGTATTPLGYAGQYTDADTGLQYLRARFYDPATAQFLTRDPIEALTREPYSYASSNPQSNVDRTGLEVESEDIECWFCLRFPSTREYEDAASEVSGVWHDIFGKSMDRWIEEEVDRIRRIEEKLDEEHDECPLGPEARPYRGANAPDEWWAKQGRPRGISRGQVRERLHDAKEGAGLSPDDDVVIGRTGDIYDPRTGERIGSLTQPVN